MMDFELNDTIAACATAPGESGVAIVRVSGPDAEKAMQKFFSMRKSGIKSHHMYYGHIINAGEPEEAMCVLMRAPRSYTRQDVCEFQIHGGGETVSRLLAALYAYGIRPAEPGEFTKRAFLNGRIDLSRAEAVMSVLRARGDAALRAGLREMNGGVAQFVIKAQDELLGMLAKIEAALDFPEEIEQTEIEGDILDSASTLASKLRDACGERAGNMLSRGLSVVLAGRPNVGKSSLMNVLLGSERAIVTRTAGTTRDVLTEEMEIDGIRMRLSDTAGQRVTGDEIEQIGVERAKTAVNAADMVLLVLDYGSPLTEEDVALLNMADERYFVVLNKRDLPEACNAIAIKSKFGERVVEISAVNMTGMDKLRKMMADYAGRAAEPDAVFLRERHIACARHAASQLDAAAQSLKNSAPVEFAAMDIRGAYASLGEITGQTASADIINRIFTDFCVGK